jgi:hypothetical protein
MIGQGAIELCNDRVGQPGIAEHDDGIHGMREAAQVFLLFLGECHGGIIVANCSRSTHAQAFKKQCSLACRTRQR